MANLRIKKRTKQLADSKEVALGDNVWTTAGEIAMQDGDKEQLSAALRAQRHASMISKVVAAIQEKAAAFVEQTLYGLMPAKVQDDYLNGDQHLALDWIRRFRWRFVQDGLTSRVFVSGKEVASMPAKVPPAIEGEVLAALRLAQARAKGVGNN